jgi:coenzyme F420-reducing hydrogenase delta subunit
MPRGSKGGSRVPEIALLYCQRATKEAVDVVAAAQAAHGCAVRPTMMPCSSKVETAHLLRLLEAGADGVELVACPEGGCRFLEGNDRAERRICRVRSLLEAARLGAERVGLSRGKGLGAGELVKRAETRARALKSLGPHPIKTAAPAGPKGGSR